VSRRVYKDMKFSRGSYSDIGSYSDRNMNMDMNKYKYSPFGLLMLMLMIMAMDMNMNMVVFSAMPLANATIQQKMMDRLNALRAVHMAPPVTWNTTLAAAALTWATTIAVADRMMHSSFSYGENIAQLQASGNYPDSASGPIDTAITLWYAEAAAYAPGEHHALHFTQLIWIATRRVGAAAVASASGRGYVVMMFDPPGNVIGAFDTNVVTLVVM
jgi:hypothetical protein